MNTLEKLGFKMNLDEDCDMWFELNGSEYKVVATFHDIDDLNAHLARKPDHALLAHIGNVYICADVNDMGYNINKGKRNGRK
jgi:hypothetical protein